MAPLRHRIILGASAITAMMILQAPVGGRSQEPDAPGQGGYMPAIRQELARLMLDARCDDATSTCWFSKTLEEQKGPVVKIVVHYSLKTSTVYMYADRFIALGQGQGPSLALARKLLDLNREMVTAKFEWDKVTDSVRLSTTINTDSNFDRRAFRSQLKGLIAVAEKVWPVLNAYAEEKSESADRTEQNGEAN